jgi:hypothetical protein
MSSAKPKCQQSTHPRIHSIHASTHPLSPRIHSIHASTHPLSPRIHSIHASTHPLSPRIHASTQSTHPRIHSVHASTHPLSPRIHASTQQYLRLSLTSSLLHFWRVSNNPNCRVFIALTRVLRSKNVGANVRCTLHGLTPATNHVLCTAGLKQLPSRTRRKELKKMCYK